ncbi:HEAT repeat domain-containing protein [Pseudomonas iridis]
MVSNEVVKVLADLLHDESEYEDLRVAAAEGLGYGGFSGARDALLQVVQDSSEGLTIRAAAIRALGRTLHTAK